MSGGRHTAADVNTEEEAPRSVFYPRGEITTAPWTGGTACGGLPVVCCTDSTRCGSFLTSDGACRRYALRGCPLRHNGGTRKTARRRRMRTRPTNSGNSAIPSVATKEEVVPV